MCVLSGLKFPKSPRRLFKDYSSPWKQKTDENIQKTQIWFDLTVDYLFVDLLKLWKNREHIRERSLQKCLWLELLVKSGNMRTILVIVKLIPIHIFYSPTSYLNKQITVQCDGGLWLHSRDYASSLGIKMSKCAQNSRKVELIVVELKVGYPWRRDYFSERV